MIKLNINGATTQLSYGSMIGRLTSLHNSCLFYLDELKKLEQICIKDNISSTCVNAELVLARINNILPKIETYAPLLKSLEAEFESIFCKNRIESELYNWESRASGIISDCGPAISLAKQIIMYANRNKKRSNRVVPIVTSFSELKDVLSDIDQSVSDLLSVICAFKDEEVTKDAVLRQFDIANKYLEDALIEAYKGANYLDTFSKAAKDPKDPNFRPCDLCPYDNYFSGLKNCAFCDCAACDCIYNCCASCTSESCEWKKYVELEED